MALFPGGRRRMRGRGMVNPRQSQRGQVMVVVAVVVEKEEGRKGRVVNEVVVEIRRRLKVVVVVVVRVDGEEEVVWDPLPVLL